MSSATATRTIKFISKAGTYSATIMCPTGDVYQEWEGSINDNPAIYPDLSVTKPILYFVCMSSRVAEGIATPDSIDIYFNGTKIEFTGDTSIGAFAGLFKKVSPSGDNPYYGLQIVGNIAAASGYAPAVVKMVAKISYGTQSDDIQADYTIKIQPATGTGYRVTIAAGDTKNFVITEKGGSVILKAKAYQAGKELTKNLTYKWYKMGLADWELMPTATAQTLTVADADIATYGEFKVEVFRDGSPDYLEFDTQGVMDASDPYDIDPHPNPDDETISEDTSGNGQVVYTPVVVKRGTNAKALNTLFYFILKDAVGVYLNAGQMATAQASFTVTRAHCLAAGGDVSLTIIAQD